MQELELRISTGALQYTFFEMYDVALSPVLSPTNRMQLTILLNKHVTNAVTRIGYEICDMLSRNQKLDPLLEQRLWGTNADYSFDIESFMTRFANMTLEDAKNKLDSVDNAMKNVFIDTILKLVGCDIYDDRIFELREFGMLDPFQTPADRVFTLKYCRKEHSPTGHANTL